MSLSAFIDTLLQNLSKEHQANLDTIDSGNLKSYEEYRHRIGVKNGFQIAEKLIIDLKKKFYYGESDSKSTDDSVVSE